MRIHCITNPSQKQKHIADCRDDVELCSWSTDPPIMYAHLVPYTILQALSFSDVNITTSDAAEETFINNTRQKKRQLSVTTVSRWVCCVLWRLQGEFCHSDLQRPHVEQAELIP